MNLSVLLSSPSGSSPLSLAALFQNGTFMTIFLVPMLLILLDFLTGVASAMVRGVFTVKQLSAILSGDVLRYLTVTLAVTFIYLLRGSATATTASSLFGMSLLTLSTLKSVIENLIECFPQQAPQIEQAVRDLGVPATALPLLPASLPSAAPAPTLAAAGVTPSTPSSQPQLQHQGAALPQVVRSNSPLPLSMQTTSPLPVASPTGQGTTGLAGEPYQGSGQSSSPSPIILPPVSLPSTVSQGPGSGTGQGSSALPFSPSPMMPTGL